MSRSAIVCIIIGNFSGFLRHSSLFGDAFCVRVCTWAQKIVSPKQYIVFIQRLWSSDTFRLNTYNAYYKFTKVTEPFAYFHLCRWDLVLRIRSVQCKWWPACWKPDNLDDGQRQLLAEQLKQQQQQHRRRQPTRTGKKTKTTNMEIGQYRLLDKLAPFVL